MERLPVKDMMCLYHQCNETAGAILKVIDAAESLRSIKKHATHTLEIEGHERSFTYSVEVLKQMLDAINAHIEVAVPVLIDAVMSGTK
jgi:hypothetical protein